MRFPWLVLLLPLAAREVLSEGLPKDTQSKIDAAVEQAIAEAGAPSASIAVVKDGEVAYLKAYGTANLESKRAASPGMRYSVGSVSKQFTATAMLLLAEEGKLSLDDPVAKYLPNLTRAREVTLREVLSMTSGYQDYWPQDYVMPGMLEPTTPEKIMERWARIPLDFEPGDKWQYSNTNYVIAGAIVEKVAGKPLVTFLKERIFGPLGMVSVTNTDEAGLGPDEPGRYMRYALGPARPAPKEGPGWLFAAGELAMTASDLARWDMSMIRESVLKPASYRTLESAVRLRNGASTGYGLGVSIGLVDGKFAVEHTGEVSGFTAFNLVFPEDRAAVVVFTNLDATGASGAAGRRIASLLFPPRAEDASIEEAKRIFRGLQGGTIDRSLFTANANAYFSPQALSDLAASLGPLGEPKEFSFEGQGLRGGMVSRRYRAAFPKVAVEISTFTTSDGKLEQYIVAAE
jgi:CubicO group peptidase (beta-lactamase class C family)